MDLYRIGNTFVGTQADARAESKTQGVRFDPAQHSAKVPTDKAGLIAYLNELVGKVEAAAYGDGAVNMSRSIRENNVVLPASERPFSAPSVIASIDAQREKNERREDLSDRATRLTALEEAIQNADGFELASLLGNVISRIEELAREARRTQGAADHEARERAKGQA